MLGVYTIELLKLIGCIVLLIIILSIMEKFVAEKLYKYKFELPKSCGKIYFPEENCYVYIYNNKEGPCEKIKYLKEKMTVINIPVHVSNLLTKPIIRTIESFKSAFTSGIPVNDTISAIGRGSELLNVGDPTNTESLRKKKWKMLIPPNFKIKCFIDKNILYIN